MFAKPYLDDGTGDIHDYGVALDDSDVPVKAGIAWGLIGDRAGWAAMVAACEHPTNPETSESTEKLARQSILKV